MLAVDDHPLLDLGAFRARFPAPLGELSSPPRALDLLRPGAPSPLGAPPSDEVRAAVRALLRHGGFRPSGRSRPASEYLVKAVEQGRLGPDRPINAAVDACNAASLHSGLPVSVVDAALLRPPLRVGIAEEGSRYVFNPSGQVIDVSGLLCLHDALGPCAGPVKDSQRTKTRPDTREVLALVWGTVALPGLCARTLALYADLLREAGAEVEVIRAPSPG